MEWQLANFTHGKNRGDKSEPKGLGHAIYCVRSFVGNEPFAVLLGDDIVDGKKPCLKQMIEVFNEKQGTILGVQEVPDEDVSKYGIVSGSQMTKDLYKVNDLIEKPGTEEAPTNIAILGRYIITPAIFEILETTKTGKGGEIQITDALKELAKIEKVYAFCFEGKRYDVGDKLGFLQATVEFALKRKDLGDGFKKYLVGLLKNEINNEVIKEIATSEE